MSTRRGLGLFYFVIAFILATSGPAFAQKKREPKLVPLDLTPGGLFLTIDVPEGANAERLAGTVVYVGDHGLVKILEETEMIVRLVELDKQTIREAKAMILLDTKETFISATLPFHCFSVTTVGDKRYWCLDAFGANDQAEAELIAKCAKTLRRTAANEAAEKQYHVSVKRLRDLGCEFDLESGWLTLKGNTVADADLKDIKAIPARTAQDQAPRVTAAGLEQLADLPYLEKVLLEGKQVSDAWLKPLTRAKKLKDVELVGTSITANGWQYFSKMSQLEVLKVQGSKIDGKALEHLEPLIHLIEVDLRRSTLSGKGIEPLAKVKHLFMLHLSGTSVNDAALDHLHGLTELEFLTLTDTKVTPKGIEKLKKALPRCQVDVDE